MRVGSIDASPAEVIAEPRRLRSAYQLLQSPQMLWIGRRHGAEVHRYTVLHHSVLVENLIEHVQGAAGIDHEIFGDDFEPVHYRFTRKDVPIMGNTQTNSYAMTAECIKAVG